MGLKIKRVDLKKDDKAVFIEFAQSAASRGGDVIDSDNKLVTHKKPHEDLLNKFTKLVPHLMFLTELAKPETDRPEFFDNYEFQDDPRFNGVKVTGVVISGKDMDMVKLLGTKTTSKKQVISFHAPLAWLNDQGVSRYPFTDILKTNISQLLDEAEKYHNGKYEPTEQGALAM